jgi:hypothetical protein
MKQDMNDLQTPKIFSLKIESIVKEKALTHMEAVLFRQDFYSYHKST